ncbi:AraC family transcriptional regulator [Cupriavidus oxalaticus]|uniref:AraC family transcriptional regulator n=1 Tax=Cupriavidus oxalaticus TaxID=96344 RepID=UPI003F738196
MSACCSRIKRRCATLSLGRIAESLGYSSYGSFVRWLTAQFGMTPTRWRNTKPADRGRRDK